jgi:FAD/FMN-containing dehydrogenase
MSAQPRATVNQAGLGEEVIGAFRARMRGAVLRPADAGYDDARHVWNQMIDRRPALIARCTGVADVVEAVCFARDNRLVVSVRGGGHNVSGSAVCEGGLMIDLSHLDGVHVDPIKRLARVQGGAAWGIVDRETQLFGLATPSGYVSTTGVAGLTLGGGFGHLRRKYGLSCDNLASVEIVTADGQIRTASETENPDLFWAIRGGGGNFGVVTSFEFRLHPVGPEVFLCAPLYVFDEAATVMRRWRDVMNSMPDDISSNASIWTLPDLPVFPEHARGKQMLLVAALYPGDPTEGERVCEPLRRLGTLLTDLSGPIAYAVAQTAFDMYFPYGQQRNYFKATYLDRLSDDVIDSIVDAGSRRPTRKCLAPVWHFGGAMSRVEPTESAFWGRRVPFMVSFDAVWDDPADDAACVGWARASWAALRHHSDGGLYVNFSGFGEEGDSLVRAAYGGNYERLVAVKNKYDPTNLFRLNQNIRPKA